MQGLKIMLLLIGCEEGQEMHWMVAFPPSLTMLFLLIIEYRKGVFHCKKFNYGTQSILDLSKSLRQSKNPG